VSATPLQHRHIHQRSRRLSWSSSRGEPVPLEAKPDMARNPARRNSVHRDGVEGGGTQRPRISTTGETRFGPAEATPPAREAYKGETRKRSNDAEQGVGGGHSTDEPWENRGEGRAATSISRPIWGKAAGLPPRGKASPRPNRAQLSGDRIVTS
jgi:hypothetical protein